MIKEPPQVVLSREVEKQLKSLGIKVTRDTTDPNDSHFCLLKVDRTYDTRIITHFDACGVFAEPEPYISLRSNHEKRYFKIRKNGTYNFDLMTKLIKRVVQNDAPLIKLGDKIEKIKQENTKLFKNTKQLPGINLAVSGVLPGVGFLYTEPYDSYTLGLGQSGRMLVTKPQAEKIHKLMMQIIEENVELRQKYLAEKEKIKKGNERSLSTTPHRSFYNLV